MYGYHLLAVTVAILRGWLELAGVARVLGGGLGGGDGGLGGGGAQRCGARELGRGVAKVDGERAVACAQRPLRHPRPGQALAGSAEAMLRSTQGSRY